MFCSFSSWAAAIPLFSTLALSSAPTTARALLPEVASIPSRAERIEVRGLPNLGRVNAGLYRGGQPDKEEGAYERLRAMGIAVVVNLRSEREEIEEERRLVEALGMEFVAIPWRVRDYPDHLRVAQFLTLLRDNSDRRIYVHCRRGADRTGVMLAAYRISVEGWTADQAVSEMEQFRFRGFWFRQLRRYVERFPQYWDSEPAFARLRTPSARPRISAREDRHPCLSGGQASLPVVLFSLSPPIHFPEMGLTDCRSVRPAGKVFARSLRTRPGLRIRTRSGVRSLPSSTALSRGRSAYANLLPRIQAQRRTAGP